MESHPRRWNEGGNARWRPNVSQACQFLDQYRGATAADLEGLGEEVRKKVYDSSGITLEWEIMRIGENKRRFDGYHRKSKTAENGPIKIIRSQKARDIEALGYVEQDNPDSGGTHGWTLG